MTFVPRILACKNAHAFWPRCFLAISYTCRPSWLVAQPQMLVCISCCGCGLRDLVPRLFRSVVFITTKQKNFFFIQWIEMWRIMQKCGYLSISTPEHRVIRTILHWWYTMSIDIWKNLQWSTQGQGLWQEIRGTRYLACADKLSERYVLYVHREQAKQTQTEDYRVLASLQISTHFLSHFWLTSSLLGTSGGNVGKVTVRLRGSHLVEPYWLSQHIHRNHGC